MATFRVDSVTENSARGVIEGLTFATNYYTSFEIELWNGSETTYYRTFRWTDSSSVNKYTYKTIQSGLYDTLGSYFSGLSSSTTYTFKAFANSGGNRNFIDRASFTTSSPPPPADTTNPTVSVSASFGGAYGKTLSISWSASDNVGIRSANAYRISVSSANDSSYYYTKENLSSSYTSTSYTTDGTGSTFIYNGYYYVKVEAWDTSGNVGIGYATVRCTDTVPLPVAPNQPTVTEIKIDSAKISWNSVTNAQAYKVEYKKSSDSTYTTYDSTTLTYITIYPLLSKTSYDVRIIAQRSDGGSGYIDGGTSPAQTFITLTPPDTTPPELIVTETSGNGEIKISWTCTDGDGVGMRSVSPYELFINSGTGTSLVSKGFVGQSSTYSFSSDGNGNAFVNNKVYSVQIKAYDNNNNVSTSPIQTITYVYVDRVIPIVTITGSNFVDTMTVNWSATDDAGLRATQTYEIRISGADNLETFSKGFVGSTTTSYTFTTDGNNLAFVHGKVYTIEIGAYDTSNNYGFKTVTKTYYISTPNNPTGTVSLYTSSGVGGRAKGIFYVQYDALSYTTGYEVRARKVSDTSVEKVVSTTQTTDVAINQLEHGTQYYVDYRGTSNVSGTIKYSSYSSTLRLTTLPEEPQITGTVSGSVITIQISNQPSGGWTDITVERYDSSNVYVDSKVITTASGTAEWTGLASNSTWKFKAKTRLNVSGTDLFSYNYSILITIQVTKPSDWKWTTANDSNGDKIKGADFRIGAIEWNNFQKRINEFRSYKKLTPYNFYDTFINSTSFTTPVNNTYIYVYYFNQALNAINDMIATGLATKVKGDDMLASDFNTLKSKLNSIT